MSTLEAIREKASALPPEKQVEVLDYIKAISAQSQLQVKDGKPHAWIDIALNANLQGPPDWSEHLDDYLYGDKKNAF